MGIRVEGYSKPELDGNSEDTIYDFQVAVAEYNTDPHSFEVESFLDSVPEELQLTALISLADLMLDEEWPLYHIKAIKGMIKKRAGGRNVTIVIGEETQC